MMRLSDIFILTFLLLTTHLAASTASAKEPDYIQEACRVTRYQDVCIQSLSSYSNVNTTNPTVWARAGVSVTLTQVRNVSEFLVELKKSRYMRGRNRIALMDCIECFGDALDGLHRSLDILRDLDARPFDVQMSDLTTWMSAVLTDEDTCLDGFDDSGRRKHGRVVRNHVRNVTYVTSNALALINKLANSPNLT